MYLLKISAVVVTFNKLALLKENLAALLQQTRPVDEIVVIDNGSQDGTGAYLDELATTQAQIHPVHTGKNLGGAGGFNAGIKNAMPSDPDWLWLMDDDTIPTATALEKLLAGLDRAGEKPGLLASNVRWTDGNPTLMNIPIPAKNWNQPTQSGLVLVESSSFVSMLINADAVRKLGLPISDFFIWGDDVEYSNRISHQYPAYFVSDSLVIHKTSSNTGVNILNDTPNRIPRYFYNVRNYLYVLKHYGRRRERVVYVFKQLAFSFLALFRKQGFKRFGAIWKGLLTSPGFHPEIEYIDAKHS